MHTIQYLLLTAVKHMRGERSLNGAMHLLKGKRSAQTIQDISFFSLNKYAGSLKTTPTTLIEQQKEIVITKEYIRFDQKRASITEAGDAFLSTWKGLPEHYNGFLFEWTNEAQVAWERLSLLMQTISHLQAGEKAFIPVYASFENRLAVKQTLRAYSIDNLQKSLHTFLSERLAQLDESSANLFVARCSGYHMAGKTYRQLGDDPVAKSLQFQAVIHYLLSNSIPSDLSFIKESKAVFNQTTQTARESAVLFRQGHSFEDVCRIRNLKASTVEDHVVELITYDKTFPYNHYISEEKVSYIHQIIKTISSTRLRLIKDASENVTYFEIRLAVAILNR
ncbi:helix-turn-helix domain-containing protein [Paenalkalicoccus suaedae]|uniref:Helix-turn-helix domain-containing protein n=1 Tax=Paenalkalicoccus suaedae TaxID=2592382 RepID=A0A859FDY6_9BACI|nr:helix-turn-helix domain-containing protein [Paenalkalicoccus suaedae]QKS71058.1 helix-turn-helix domain-containing protein [Paenalkalicoccus suaedae]